jgi:hypothetical protein
MTGREPPSFFCHKIFSNKFDIAFHHFLMACYVSEGKSAPFVVLPEQKIPEERSLEIRSLSAGMNEKTFH